MNDKTNDIGKLIANPEKIDDLLTMIARTFYNLEKGQDVSQYIMHIRSWMQEHASEYMMH